MTYTYLTPTNKVEGLSLGEAALMVWENHRNHWLNNGNDVYHVDNARRALEENRILDVTVTSNARIRIAEVVAMVKRSDLNS